MNFFNTDIMKHPVPQVPILSKMKGYPRFSIQINACQVAQVCICIADYCLNVKLNSFLILGNVHIQMMIDCSIILNQYDWKLNENWHENSTKNVINEF